MFAKLFAESGLSLDRLRALVEVGASGSIVKAASGDPVKQSQYSRQIKELEDFFHTELTERQGKGIRLTPHGKELARISRFFLLGLANFHRGCLTEGQSFRLGASATAIDMLLLPAFARLQTVGPGTSYAVEEVADEEIERRLHELTLDFGIITKPAISRPLQVKALRAWGLKLWLPKSWAYKPKQAEQALKEKQLPLVLARKELSHFEHPVLSDYEPDLTCDNFLQAKAAMEKESLAAFLPDFFGPGINAGKFVSLRIADIEKHQFHYRLAWNPRLLRLNRHATRMRDSLLTELTINLG